MPFPSRQDPAFCIGSDLIVEPTDRPWHRCEVCGRLVGSGPRGKTFPHLSDQRRGRHDDSREILWQSGYRRP